MEEATILCVSCGAKLKGKYCHKCGEKRLVPERDFSIWEFAKDIFMRFSHLDSKLLQTLKHLCLQPGFLTTAFARGQRVNYLKPLPFFAFASLLFYLFLSSATAFYSNFNNLHDGYKTGNRFSNTLQIDTETLFRQKMAAAGVTDPDLYLKALSDDASQCSKAWLFLIIPMWGSLIWLVFRRRNKWLVPHLIFALHNLTFFILFDMLALLVCKYLLGMNMLGDGYILFIMIVFSLYNILAVRQMYETSWLKSIVGGIVLTLLFLIVLLIYRQAISLSVLMHA